MSAVASCDGTVSGVLMIDIIKHVNPIRSSYSKHACGLLEFMLAVSSSDSRNIGGANLGCQHVFLPFRCSHLILNLAQIQDCIMLIFLEIYQDLAVRNFIATSQLVIVNKLFLRKYQGISFPSSGAIAKL